MWGKGQWIRSVDPSDGLRIKSVPQPRGPAFHTSAPPARGHKCEKSCVWGVGVVCDAAAGSSVDSPVVNVLQRC